MREHPTIPEIVQALVTLNDRHQADMKKIRADHVERLRRLQASVDGSPMPPLNKWECFDVEYAEFITDEDGDGYFQNKFKNVESRDDALGVARELLANEQVASIHFRFQKANVTSSWALDGHQETNLLAKAQNDAFTWRKELKALGKKYDELYAKKERMAADWDADVESLNVRLAARDEVIDQLLTRIRRVYEQLRRDNSNCVYSEPVDIMNLLVGVGTEPDEQWFKDMLDEALKKEKQRAKDRKSRELGERTGLEEDPAVEPVTCLCGKVWEDGRLPAGHNIIAACFGEDVPCVVCGHEKGRHTKSLPEEGREDYCTECDGEAVYHLFDPVVVKDSGLEKRNV
jgi:hypothetical protein